MNQQLSTSNVQAGYDDLQQSIRQFDRALIAYSGGVDSALVMAAAHTAIGDRAMACTAVSPSYPQRELQAAIAFAKDVGIQHRLVNTEEHLDPRYAANPSNRCYFCKSELYQRLSQLAADERWTVVLDGTNATDLTEDRPGRQAAIEHGVRSPLAELGLTKPRVREIAREAGLSVWDKPAMPCLSSRVPHGMAIVPELLGRIERAEDVLVALGFKQFRVRHHGDVARIELAAADIARALEHRDAIVTGVRSAGYRFVTLDLAGLRNV